MDYWQKEAFMKAIRAIINFFWSIIVAIVSPEEGKEKYGVVGLHELPEPNLYDAQ